MKGQLHNNYELFQHNIFKQMENLPVIIQKYEHLEQDQAITVDDIKGFISEIQEVLENTGKNLARQQEIDKNMGGEEVVAD